MTLGTTRNAIPFKIPRSRTCAAGLVQPGVLLGLFLAGCGAGCGGGGHQDSSVTTRDTTPPEISAQVSGEPEGPFLASGTDLTRPLATTFSVLTVTGRVTDAGGVDTIQPPQLLVYGPQGQVLQTTVMEPSGESAWRALARVREAEAGTKTDNGANVRTFVIRARDVNGNVAEVSVGNFVYAAGR